MSKCYKCKQDLPELHAVKVWCSDYDLNRIGDRSYGSTECRVEGSRMVGLIHLLNSGKQLVLVPEEQFKVAPSVVGPDMEQLRKHSNELARKLDDIRRMVRVSV